jgi:hypothetical protein
MYACKITAYISAMLLLVAAARAQSPGSLPDSVVSTSPSGLRLLLSAPGGIYTNGQPIQVLVVLTNAGPDAVAAPLVKPTGGLDFAITNSAGLPVPLKQFRHGEHFSGPAAVKVVSGGTIADSVDLSQYYDLEPGTFQVQAIRDVTEWPPQGRTTIASDIMRLVVVAGGTSRDEPPIQWGASSEGFQIGIRLKLGTFKAGESVEAEIITRNTTRTNLVLRVGSSAGPGGDLYDGYGIVVMKGTNVLHSTVNRATEPWSLGVGSSAFVRVAPGELHKHTVRLDREFDLNGEGTYSVSAFSQVPKLQGVGSAQIATGKAIFAILSAPEKSARPANL